MSRRVDAVLSETSELHGRERHEQLAREWLGLIDEIENSSGVAGVMVIMRDRDETRTFEGVRSDVTYASTVPIEFWIDMLGSYMRCNPELMPRLLRAMGGVVVELPPAGGVLAGTPSVPQA